MQKTDHKKHILKILELVNDLLSTSALKNKKVDMVNSNGEKPMEIDLQVEDLVVEYIKSHHLPYKIFAEEGGFIDFTEDAEFLVAFDPLDGSTNYSVGKNLLPYGFLIAVYNNLEPKMSDVICAGALEFTDKLSWLYNGGETFKIINGKPVPMDKIDQKIVPDLHTPVYLDLYKKVSYDFYASFVQKIFIRNTGSTIGNLALTLEGASTALGGSTIKAEEIGALYSLIKGAGGEIIDEQGNDFGEIPFSGSKFFEVLGGNPSVIDLMKSIIKEKQAG
jgi:fructose-1,6-bisphosphatase/inositol monophosphatase family enzyme